MEKKLTRAELLSSIGKTSGVLDMMGHRNQHPFPFAREREAGVYGAMDTVAWRLADALVPTFGRANAAHIVRTHSDTWFDLVRRIENEAAADMLVFVGCTPPPDEWFTVSGGTRAEIGADLERLAAEDRASSAAFIDMNKLLADVRALAKAGGVDLSGQVFVLTPEEEAERRGRLHEAIAERRAGKPRTAKARALASARGTVLQ
jgi:hypothetical protein